MENINHHESCLFDDYVVTDATKLTWTGDEETGHGNVKHEKLGWYDKWQFH